MSFRAQKVNKYACVLLVLACLGGTLYFLPQQGNASDSYDTSSISNVDVNLQSAVNSYENLVKGIYLQDSNELDKHSDSEINAVKPEIDDLRKSYTDYGMSIVDASVSMDIEDIQNNKDSVDVRALVHTELKFTPPTDAETQEAQESSWDDIHHFEFGINPLTRSVDSDSLNEDSIIPEGESDTDGSLVDGTQSSTIDAPQGTKLDFQRTAGAAPAINFMGAGRYAVKWTSGKNAGDENRILIRTILISILKKGTARILFHRLCMKEVDCLLMVEF